MQVEMHWEVEGSEEPIEVPWENPARGTQYLDLRSEPAAISQIEAARRQRPLQTFLAALNGADSVFSTVRASVWLAPETPTDAELNEFVSRVDLMFAAEELNLDRGHYEGLVQRLVELLTRDAGDTLSVRLAVRRCFFRETNRQGYALAMFLTARGETPGQAELRWGLGLVRLQQALLFLSRVVRQHLAHSN